MPELESLKRQIVRQTVDENIALIEGTRRLQAREIRAKKMRAWAWTLLGLLLGVTGMVLASNSRLPSHLLAGLADARFSRDAATSASSSAAETRSEAVAARPDPSRWSSEPVPLEKADMGSIDPAVFPLEVKRIVLDPGHGGEDLGTRNVSLHEKDLTLDIASRLGDLLRVEGFEVSLTRDSDREVVLRERRDFANRAVADVFISIHINWIADRAVRGVETYYLGLAKDPELNALAMIENENSGYTLAEQSSLVRGAILNTQHEVSRLLAERIQTSLYRSLRQVNPELQNRGVKTAPFVVLIGTEMPAILAEVSCLSNEDEVELLQKPLYKDHIAQALFKGILAFAREINPESRAQLGP